MKHILLVFYGGGHMKVLAPLYPVLSQRYRVTLLALTTAGHYVQSLGYPYISFKDLPWMQDANIQRYGAELAAALPENTQVPLEETRAYLGSCFNDLVNQLGDEAKARQRYQQQGRAAFLPIATLKRIIETLGIDMVVSTNSPRAERAALIAAKALQLPSLCVNDNLWSAGGATDIAAQQLSDRLCVLTEQVKQQLLQITHCDPSYIKVTGTPVFDSLKQQQWQANSTDCPRVLLADCVLPDTNPFFPQVGNKEPGIDLAIRAELNRLAGLGKIQAYLRPHPNQQIDYTLYTHCKVSPPSEDLHTRLAKTDIVVTAISTVGIEGKMLGLGLVSLEGTVYSTLESYQQMGLSTGIESADALEAAIFSEYESFRKAPHNTLYPGLAVDNICQEIESVLLTYQS